MTWLSKEEWIKKQIKDRLDPIIKLDDYNTWTKHKQSVIKRWISIYHYLDHTPKRISEIYDHYLIQNECECCGIEFTKPPSKYNKCMDHSHTIRKYRWTICNECNRLESWDKNKFDEANYNYEDDKWNENEMNINNPLQWNVIIVQADQYEFLSDTDTDEDTL